MKYPLTTAQLGALRASSVADQATHRTYSVRSTLENQIVGHGEIGQIDREARTARLMRILVGPVTLRGKGYGRGITKELVRISFEDLGLESIDLNVFTFNRAAIRCYQTVGFEVVNSAKRSRGKGEISWDVHRMKLHKCSWDGA